VAGAAVRVTAVPVVAVNAQAVPQEIPVGTVDVTVPEPVVMTVSAREVAGMAVNVAVTVRAAPRVTVHVPVPVQPPPLQPLNVKLVAGVAINTTEVPEG
jgi:hypothetical protein